MWNFKVIFLPNNWQQIPQDWKQGKIGAQHIPLPDGPGQVKLSVRQVDLDKFFFEIIYDVVLKKQILEVGQVQSSAAITRFLGSKKSIAL